MTHPAAAASGPWLAQAREEIERLGLAVEWISGGGTPEAHRVHESGVFTELRVGTYVYGDRRCLELGVTPLEDCALRVVATVVSRPTRDHAVLDAGSKTLTSDTLPGLEAGTYGLVVEYPGRGRPPPVRGARRRRSLRLRTESRDRRRGHDRPEPRVRHGQHARPDRVAPRRRATSRSSPSRAAASSVESSASA